MSRVHAARDHAVDLLLGFAAEVGSECRLPFQGYGPISRHSNLKLRSPVNQKGRNWRTLPSI